MTSPAPSNPPVPLKLHLDRERQLDITWADGQHSVYSLSYLRTSCPCASCRTFREQQAEQKASAKRSLTILPGNFSGKIVAKKAELVGNYALRIEWSDDHDTGIYSFEYLHSIRPSAAD